MIGSLRGSVIDHRGGEVLVEVAGVGYRVQVTPAMEAAAPTGSELFLHIHHHRRDDAEVLYGFPTSEERRVFETLIATHGVGPSLGLAILGVHSPDALAEIVASNDAAALCLVPGIGKKTAARLLVELGSRLSAQSIDLTAAIVGAGPAGSPRSDVREALAALGYSAEEIGRAVGDLPDDLDSGELLRRALQKLAAS